MTNVQIIVVLSSFGLVVLASIWLYLKQIKRDREATKEFNRVLTDPRVRSLIYQLIRNQYFESPKNSEQRRSNNRRALAMVQLRRVVKDSRIRQKLYRLTDKSRW